MSLSHDVFIIPEMATAITEKSPATERMPFSDRLQVLEKEVANLACHRLLIFLPACILDCKVNLS
jgi:hypothetical protein